MKVKNSLKALLCILWIALYIGGCYGKQSFRPDSTEPVPEVASGKLLSVREMAEDLEFTIGVLGDVHPQTYHGFSKKQKQLIESMRSGITEPMEARRFYFIINELFVSFRDGHTRLRPLKNKHNKIIDAGFVWLHNGLYVTSDGVKLKHGDKIIAIGDKSIDKLLEELTHIIPAENIHFVKYMAGDSLIREAYLDELNLIQDDSVKYTIRRGERQLTVNMPLIKNSEIISKKTSRPWVRFEIDEKLSLGIFTLDECKYNDEYKEKLKAFFGEVRKHNVQHVAVDVRKNGGGSSQVIDEFLSYLNIKRYRRFSMEVRYSRATAKQSNTHKDRGYDKPLFRFNTSDNRKCPNPELIFNGKLYILVSAETFSSGNWFAVIVKDNKLGTVIGEPTGNQPTSYGDVLSFQMPNTGFRFICSFKKWIRPDTSNDPEDSLYPDVMAYTTIGDIIQNKDAQIEKLKSIVKTK
ncbi:MAG: hypothetical protein JSW23_07325 [Planctomycetota bacterium]|nr:MAG: hypothetical protein JSW23_07325 [Planctomycetota bacterium]